MGVAAAVLTRGVQRSHPLAEETPAATPLVWVCLCGQKRVFAGFTSVSGGVVVVLAETPFLVKMQHVVTETLLILWL